MKAVVCNQFGSPHLLQFQEIEKPIPKDNQVLVKVLGASITFSTMMMVTGDPSWTRMIFGGLRAPRTRIPGSDIAGRVEAVGKNVTRFRPGDEVYGDLSICGRGGFAEYVCAPENALALKPSNLSFEEASAVPEAALVALQALRDYGKIQPGQKMLVYGASGGIGTFAVQLAKILGAEVTGVCSTRNLEMVRSIGADHVVDYTREDFIKNGQKYDLIVATAGYRSVLDYKRALSPNGIYVSTGGSWSQIFQAIFLGPLLSLTGSKKLKSMLVKPNKELPFIKELLEADKLKPVIDRCYPFNEIPAALQYYSEGHARGKVVISMAGGLS